MKVEHLTIGGNAIIRDTNDILPTTKAALDSISLSYDSKFLILPSLPFKIKISAAENGAVFDLMKGDQIATTNLCCFGENDSDYILSLVSMIADEFNKAKTGWKIIVKEPVTPQWLYTILINPFILSHTDIMLAGEVELYIFERLFSVYKIMRTK